MDSLQKRIEQHTAATGRLRAEIDAAIEDHRKAITVLEAQRNALIDQTQNALSLDAAVPAPPS